MAATIKRAENKGGGNREEKTHTHTAKYDF